MNKRSSTFCLVLGAVAAAAAGGPVAGGSAWAGDTTVASLVRETHFHGIAVDAADPKRLYLATHHGFYIVDRDGQARLVSQSRDDFMGFTAHPTDPSVLFASGHPRGGGNLGFVASTDGGRSWRKISDGIGGPVDFHQMDVSKADPKVVYGIHGNLQRSDDGGASWRAIGPAPDGIICLATSSLDTETLYAATQRGLLRSTDGGRSWQAAHILRRPATMVHVTGAGEGYAFIVGTGLVRTTEPGLNWRTVSNAFGEDYILHLAVAPGGRNLYAVTINGQTHAQAVRASDDGGATWTPVGGR